VITCGPRVGRRARHARLLRFDSAREQHVLLAPEAVIVLNGTARTFSVSATGIGRWPRSCGAARRYDRVIDGEVRQSSLACHQALLW